ncbi:MAG: ABC transporter ATP-binding protein [Lentisphaerae bacterium]|nr:ABC transporter ATP-binding protein [Lentisphaerota bacterium]
MDMENILFDLQNLSVEFRTDEETVYAVNNVSIKLAAFKTLGIVGETGAGKTTTAKALLRLTPKHSVVTCNKLEINGRDVMKLSAKDLEKMRGQDIAMIFQDPMTSLNPVMTVGKQITESILIHQAVSKTDAVRQAEKMLELVGIPASRAGEYPHQFSGGMRQRVVIAIALSCNPKILIADEPTTALDVTIQGQVLDLMKNLKKQYGTSMIMITHDLGIVAEICDDVAVMYAGTIVERGTISDIFRETLHPYTEGLFNSLPNIKNRRNRLKPIPGMMPDPTKKPDGCPFAPRCGYVNQRCVNTPLVERQISDTHFVSCIAYDNPNFKIERRR